MIIDFINLNGGGGGGGYTLPVASQSTLGGIKVGSGLTINSGGTLSADAQPVGIATTASTGVVKIGSGITVDSAGTISVDGQGGGIEVVTELPASGTDGQMVILVETVNGIEKQNLYVYGTEPKPAIDFNLSQDKKMFDMSWTDIQRVMDDGDVLFYVDNFSNMDIRYSGGTLYSENQSGWGVNTPTSTTKEYGGVLMALYGDRLTFWFRQNRSVSGGTLFSGKSQLSGWTRYDVQQNDNSMGYAEQYKPGYVMVGNGLSINNGQLSCSVTVATATTASTGVVKVSSGLSITNQGALSTQVQASNVGNNVVHIWLGTQAEYDLISTPDQYTVYIIKEATQGA